GIGVRHGQIDPQLMQIPKHLDLTRDAGGEIASRFSLPINLSLNESRQIKVLWAKVGHGSCIQMIC
ncbi:MAG: hypothetical protein ACRDAP_05720, partial [Shewanella sp.]